MPLPTESAWRLTRPAPTPPAPGPAQALNPQLRPVWRQWLASLAAGLALAAALPAQAADPVRGATLYASSPGGGQQSCANCHGSSPLTSNGSRIYNGRNSRAIIQSAVSSNVGGMGYFSSYYTATEYSDIAAYLGNTPSTISFASTAVGASSAVQTVTVKASTATSITGLSVSSSGDFARSGGTCGTSVSTGTSCTVGVVFSPTAAGSRTGSLLITHSGVSTPVSIALSGTATGGTSTAPVASLSAASLAFASTTVGQTATAQQVTLSNTGNAALSISAITSSNTSDFPVAGGTCVAGGSVAAGGSCTVSVSFKPTAAGARSASLSITHNASGSPSTVALSGTGTAAAAPLAAVSPSSLSFGSTTVGQTATAQTVTLSNTGSAALTLGTLANPSSEFTISGGTCASSGVVAAGSSCTVTLVFVPSASGARSATLSLPHNASNSPSTVALSGTGVAAAPAASAAPAGLSFTQAVGGTSASQTVTLSNTGSAVLTISTITLIGTNSADFSLAAGGTCTAGGSVAAGASCTLLPRFAPTAVGIRSASISIGHNATGSPTTVSLAGTATATPQGTLSLNASSLDFGSSVVGTAAAARTITASNTGAASLTFSSLAISGTAAGDFSRSGTCATGTPLAAGGTCTLVIGFTPGALGSRSGTLTLASDASNPSAAVSLAGTGTAAPVPVAALSPASLDFGNQTVGSSSVLRAVTLSNTGSGAMSISAISTALPFSQNNNCGSSLAAGANCTVNLSFSPTALGAASGSLTVTSNASGSPHAVALTGTGVASLPVLSWSPASTSLAWGSVNVGASSSVTSVGLHNAGPGSATLQAPAITGSQAADFSLASSNTCSAGKVLAAGADCTLALVFSPQGAGARSASLAIVSDASSPGSLALSGTGVAVAAPTATLSASSLAFTSSGVAQTLSISNSGAAELVVSGLAVASGPFTVSAAASNGCAAVPFTLLPGQSCAVSVAWSSSSDSSDTGALTITSNATASPQTVALSASRSSGSDSSSNDDSTKAKGGGGCSIAPQGLFDPLLPLLALAAAGVLWWRRRQG